MNETNETKITRDYNHREGTTKSVTVRKDDRTIEEQVKEIRSTLRAALDYLQQNWVTWSCVPISLNGNPKYGTVGDFLKKYNDKGELII